MTDTSGPTGTEVELRRRLDALAGVACIEDDGWEDLQARLAAHRPRRRPARPAPLALVAAAAAAVAAIALIPHDTEERARTVDGTTTTTRDGSANSTSTSSTAPETTSTTGAGEAGLSPGPGVPPPGPAPGGAGGTGAGGPGAAGQGGGTGTAEPAPGAPVTPTTAPPPTYVPGEGADLEVTLSASGSVTFTARVVNHGADVAVAARATVTLSDTMIVNSVTSSAGACTAQGGMVYSCDLGDLAAGAAVTITVDAQVWASPGSALTATVAAGSAVPDPVGPGSSARASVTA